MSKDEPEAAGTALPRSEPGPGEVFHKDNKIATQGSGHWAIAPVDVYSNGAAKKPFDNQAPSANLGTKQTDRTLINEKTVWTTAGWLDAAVSSETEGHPSVGCPSPDPGWLAVANGAYLGAARAGSSAADIKIENAPPVRTYDPSTQDHNGPGTPGNCGGIVLEGRNPMDNAALENLLRKACKITEANGQCEHGRAFGLPRGLDQGVASEEDKASYLEVLLDDTVDVSTVVAALIDGLDNCCNPHPKWTVSESHSNHDECEPAERAQVGGTTYALSKVECSVAEGTTASVETTKQTESDETYKELYEQSANRAKGKSPDSPEAQHYRKMQEAAQAKQEAQDKVKAIRAKQAELDEEIAGADKQYQRDVSTVKRRGRRPASQSAHDTAIARAKEKRDHAKEEAKAEREALDAEVEEHTELQAEKHWEEHVEEEGEKQAMRGEAWVEDGKRPPEPDQKLRGGIDKATAGRAIEAGMQLANDATQFLEVMDWRMNQHIAKIDIEACAGTRTLTVAFYPEKEYKFDLTLSTLASLRRWLGWAKFSIGIVTFLRDNHIPFLKAPNVKFSFLENLTFMANVRFREMDPEAPEASTADDVAAAKSAASDAEARKAGMLVKRDIEAKEERLEQIPDELEDKWAHKPANFSDDRRNKRQIRELAAEQSAARKDVAEAKEYLRSLDEKTRTEIDILDEIERRVERGEDLTAVIQDLVERMGTKAYLVNEVYQDYEKEVDLRKAAQKRYEDARKEVDEKEEKVKECEQNLTDAENAAYTDYSPRVETRDGVKCRIYPRPGGGEDVVPEDSVEEWKAKRRRELGLADDQDPSLPWDQGDLSTRYGELQDARGTRDAAKEKEEALRQAAQKLDAKGLTRKARTSGSRGPNLVGVEYSLGFAAKPLLMIQVKHTVPLERILNIVFPAAGFIAAEVVGWIKEYVSVVAEGFLMFEASLEAALKVHHSPEGEWEGSFDGEFCFGLFIGICVAFHGLEVEAKAGPKVTGSLGLEYNGERAAIPFSLETFFVFDSGASFDFWGIHKANTQFESIDGHKTSYSHKFESMSFTGSKYFLWAEDTERKVGWDKMSEV